jgi:hypothetical protein
MPCKTVYYKQRRIQTMIPSVFDPVSIPPREYEREEPIRMPEEEPRPEETSSREDESGRPRDDERGSRVDEYA